MDNLKKQRLINRYKKAIEESNFDTETQEKMKSILDEINNENINDIESKNFFDILREEFDNENHDDLEELIKDLNQASDCEI
jgi:hypothetical protein